MEESKTPTPSLRQQLS